jgi:CelD/BcsL family acetyltransferase involved in cellulose biosynthesis
VRLTTYNTPDALQTLAAEWRALLPRSTSNHIFSTPEWNITWWDVYQAGELWLVAVRADEGQLLAIAPWFIEQRPDERVVRTIGCVDVTDYVDLIVDRDFTQPVCELLAAHLFAERDRYDRINMCNIPAASPTLVHLKNALAACGMTAEAVLQEVCPIIHLPDSFETYVENLDKKDRHELRRKLRRMEGEETAWYIVGAEHDLDAELDRFLDLMTKSAPAKAEFLADTRNARFLRESAKVAYDQSWLQLCFLRVNGDIIASYLNFDYNHQILVYNSGFSLERYASLSPGIVLLAHLIEHAIQQGRTIFDFLRGNEVYKYRMGAIDTQVFMLKAE